ncbi:hypothetical protein LTR49_026865 [Elasticomyces elasticus]|nr:hypothetical protein LTR49_026865 [Elasticomyces elasticus]
MELRRRDGMRAFDDIDVRRAATIYEYAFDTSEDSDVEVTNDAMTQQEWNMLPNEPVQTPYNAYESNQQAIARHASLLSSALTAIVYELRDQIQTYIAVSGILQTLVDFDSAIAGLSSASHFIESSRYMDDDWGIIDNTQLFAPLHTMILLTNTVISVELCTRGHAFWNAAHLRRLLDWNERIRLHWDPVNEGSWIDTIGGPLEAFQHIEAATRHLTHIERAFSHLATLDY